MFRKIWNTLREGDSRTKAFLLTVTVLLFGAVILFVVALVKKAVLPALAVAAFAIILIAIAMNALSVVNSGKNKKQGRIKKPEKEKKQNKQQKIKGDLLFEDMTNEDATEEQEKKKNKKQKKKEAEAEQERMEREQEDEEEFGENALATMTVEKLKRLLIRYKVKQEHVPVIIDLCIPERVRQAPGFAWVDDGMLKVLLIERKPRMLERPLSRLQVMQVERGIAVKASSEYVELRDSEVMKKAFTPYLPRYQKKEIGGRTVLMKNLYVLDEDIKFTSTSVNELKKLFSFRIEIADRRLQEMDLSPYYKKVYVDSFLWRDGILTLQQFKTEVESVIDSLAEPMVPYGEFETTISAMVNSGLLPAEYRGYALSKREEKEQGVSEKKEKGKGKGKRK